MKPPFSGCVEFRTLGTRWTRVSTLSAWPRAPSSLRTRALFRRYQSGDTQYFDRFSHKFHTEDGIVHGLAHWGGPTSLDSPRAKLRWTLGLRALGMLRCVYRKPRSPGGEPDRRPGLAGGWGKRAGPAGGTLCLRPAGPWVCAAVRGKVRGHADVGACTATEGPDTTRAVHAVALHLRQDDGFVHALDLRTVGRPEWRNRATELRFQGAGLRIRCVAQSITATR